MRVEAELIRHVSAEEDELAKKRLELALLVTVLTDRELVLVTTKAEIGAFETLYLREVGVLYAELDDWLATIAELVAARTSTSANVTAAQNARRQADETRTALSVGVTSLSALPASQELKSLFREVARAVHQDRANGEADRFLRERLMKNATEAFACADVETLRKIIEEYASSAESVHGTGDVADLLRVVRHIQQITKRLAAIELEMAAVLATDMANLRTRYEGGLTQNRNLLAEMAASVQEQNEVAK